MDNILKKVCFKCKQEKPISAFHKHSRMKDGHLNKCGVCTTDDTRKWRKKQPEGERYRRYLREIGREASSARIKIRTARGHVKKRCSSFQVTEWDAFVFDECVTLNILRENLTGIKWSIDHIVPFKHKLACGLNVAANIQSVPLSYNVRKRNEHMEPYWPTKSVGVMGY